jgi:hypothetical protein
MSFANHYLGESSHSRIIQHIENDKSFAVISAFEKDHSNSENLKAHEQLIADVRKLNLGYIEQSSGYTYSNKAGESRRVEEMSLFIPEIDYKAALNLAIKYNQESFLFKSKDKGFVLIYARDGIDSEGNHFKKEQIGLKFKTEKNKEGKITFNPEVLKYAYSALIKANNKPYAFVIESISEGTIPERSLSIKQKPNKMTWTNILP